MKDKSLGDGREIGIDETFVYSEFGCLEILVGFMREFGSLSSTPVRRGACPSGD